MRTKLGFVVQPTDEPHGEFSQAQLKQLWYRYTEYHQYWDRLDYVSAYLDYGDGRGLHENYRSYAVFDPTSNISLRKQEM